MTDAHMRRAIELSRKSIPQGGGPFGAVVVLDGRVLGEGRNRVVPDGDPTAHAEINAIRNACRAQGSPSLQGAVIYTSCEPCPMCLAAIWWARISRIVFANSRDAAANIGLTMPRSNRGKRASRKSKNKDRAKRRCWREGSIRGLGAKGRQGTVLNDVSRGNGSELPLPLREEGWGEGSRPNDRSQPRHPDRN